MAKSTRKQTKHPPFDVGFVEYFPENRMPTPFDILGCGIYPSEQSTPLAAAVQRFLNGDSLAVLEAFELYDRIGAYPDVRLLKWFATRLREYFANHSNKRLDEVLGIVREGTGHRSLLQKRATEERDYFMCRVAYVLEKHCGMPKKIALSTVARLCEGKHEWRIGPFVFQISGLTEKGAFGSFARRYQRWRKESAARGHQLVIDGWDQDRVRLFIRQFPREKLPRDLHKYF